MNIKACHNYKCQYYYTVLEVPEKERNAGHFDGVFNMKRDRFFHKDVRGEEFVLCEDCHNAVVMADGGSYRCSKCDLYHSSCICDWLESKGLSHNDKAIIRG